MSSTSHAGSTSSIDIPQGLEDAPLMSDLDEIAALQRAVGPLYLRYSPGPVVDARTGSHDQESGCDLPGLAAAPLTPEPWWDRPEEEWIARQLCQYTHMWVRPRNAGWLLTGDVIGRGCNSEPLLANARPVALVTQRCVEHAASVYERAFHPGRS
ncbi:DUF6098 family protein [Sanguibacter antarcticus]|uniref:Uncharacterized protein n=1 Tax=Sanguibacter antarcticus TaxID=372484 RepID=A0A2A9E6L8_9MICO|nr:DUF6098 family protein [Sanguibacter antarcticus]PFG34484.1 hypothetical protein ATL42_2394 [Sanguibacter antarcticus]